MVTEFNFPWLNLKTISDLRMTLSGTWLDFITTSPRRRKASGQYMLVITYAKILYSMI